MEGGKVPYEGTMVQQRIVQQLVVSALLLRRMDSGDNPSRSFLIRHPVIRQEGFRFNPSEIAPALFRWHRLAYLEEVAKHHPLTLRAHSPCIGQRYVNLRRYICRARK